MPTASPITLLRLPAVLARTGRTRAAHYNDITDGLMTPAVPIGGRAVAWPDAEVDAIVRARVAGWCDDRIRALVRYLLDHRADAAPDIAA